MVKLIGVLLLMVGSVGFAATLCTEQRKKLLLLVQLRKMFVLIQEDIRYSGLPLPLIIEKTAKKIKEPFRKALTKISKEIVTNGGEMLCEVWEKEMKNIFKELAFSKKQQELLLEFPDSLGFWEREGQAKALTFYIEESDKWISQMEKEEKNKNKVIMSLGAATGILLSVLLL